MATVLQISFTVLVAILCVRCKSPFDFEFDQMKDEEYHTVIQAVLDLAFRTRHFDTLSCEDWCRSSVSGYFSPKVDVTPKCSLECQEFIIHHERANGADL